MCGDTGLAGSMFVCHPQGDAFMWDIFVSHASEDKADVASPLSDLLKQAGLAVWFDVDELRVGDPLLTKIDNGLANSRYGVVVLSPAFFAKHWTQLELNGLAALASSSRKVILPVWHGVDHATVARYSPTLAGLLASNTTKGLPTVADEIVAAVHSQRRGRPIPAENSRTSWRRLMIIVIAIIAMASGVFLWVPRARGKSVEIHSPRPDSRVSNLSQLVYGNSSKVYSGDEIWPVLFSRDDGHYYIHANHTKVASGGRWCSAHVLLPADHAPGTSDFEIVALLLNSEAAKVLSDELRTNPALTRIESLPAGATPGDRTGIKIVRPLIGDTGTDPGCDAILGVQNEHDSTWLSKLWQVLRMMGGFSIAIGIVIRLLSGHQGAGFRRLRLPKRGVPISLILGGLALLVLGVFSEAMASWVLDKSRNHEAAFRGANSNKDLLHIDGGAEVDPEINVDLSSARLRSGYNRWVVVRSNADSIYFPQRCMVGDPGPSSLTCGLEIGGASDFGAAFDILLVEANEDASRYLDRYIAQPERQGLVELPAGNEVIYSFRVVRKGRKETQQ